MDRSSIIHLIHNTAQMRPELQLCILYGSAAQDRMRVASDIDVAVASENGLSHDFCLDFSRQLSLESGSEVSVLDLEKLDGVILQEILSKGIRIKNSNTLLLAKYIIKMYDFSVDIQPLQILGLKKMTQKYLYE